MSVPVPDVIGCDLRLAEEIMTKCGHTCVVVLTTPPAGEIEGELRVIRQRAVGPDPIIELVAARDGSPKGGALHGSRNR
ncbi:MAG: hypothetical protein HPY71_01935 [Firmicutes bacterium]|nr:hypothetical protein [Bacillota bacterium]